MDELLFWSVFAILLVGTAWNHSDPTKRIQEVSACAHDFSKISKAYMIESYLQLLFPPCMTQPRRIRHVSNTQTLTTEGSSFKIQTMFSPFGTSQEQVRLAEMLSADREDQQRAMGPIST